ncbi:hypothetical protein GGD81_004586 [Rhodobium orientis]|uniref:Uncharacterized protein n=1 Tax=Rhodobium orientis TaxID=34017 RepID=A0A327JEG5_9HYPH|nr:hypothetical protein [Rhodobium orientis]MBB4305506.1 hypothetical protein [Rhodobium orientis]MBK5949855.1 hypothetical protein [Rhodobium orientis]RAI24729.1 hypothetical protein CH339_21410 [Rhodobium orientis]
MKLFLHIGTSKTGTSFIQGSLAASREKLARGGICYPGPQQSQFWLVSHFHEAPETIGLNIKRGYGDRAAIRADTTRYLKRLDDALKDNSFDSLILSSEYFSILSAEALRELAGHFQKVASEVTVVCYVRHPVSHAASAMQQDVKTGHRTLKECFAEPRFSRFSRMLPKFIEVFGKENVVVRPFEYDALHEGDVRTDFCTFAGIDPSLIEESATFRNESVSAEAALLLDALAESAPKLEGKRRNADRAKNLRGLAAIGGAPFALPEEVADRVRAACADDLAYLRETFGIALSEPEMSPATGPDWSQETLLDLARLINDQAVEAERLKAIVLYQSGVLALYDNDPERAIASFDRALAFDPELEVARKERADARLESPATAKLKRSLLSVFGGHGPAAALSGLKLLRDRQTDEGGSA